MESGQRDLTVMPKSNGPLVKILVAGTVAGAFDIAYACVFWGVKADVPAMRIFQSVASGVFGSASFRGGVLTAAIGLAFHFLIAIAMSAVFYNIARQWPALWQRPLISGALYGLCLYAIMNFVVVPLSAAAPGSTDPTWIWMSISVHMLFVGIPIALITRSCDSSGTVRPR